MKKLTAITLCIVMVSCTLCTIACVTDTNCKNARFFAADFSLVCTNHTETALSDIRDIRIVSWIKNPEFTFESEVISGMSASFLTAFADKLLLFVAECFEDFYTGFKTTSYFLRI